MMSNLHGPARLLTRFLQWVPMLFCASLPLAGHAATATASDPSSSPVPIQLGRFTFKIPFNYLSVNGEPAPKNLPIEPLRYADARSGPIKFFLWDFSGMSPWRARSVGKSDEFVSYNFGVYPTPSPRDMFARAPGQYAATPDFREAGLSGYLPQLAGAEAMSKEARRQKHLVLWVGKSSHGGDIVLECSMSSATCLGYGKHPVGGYDYQFSFAIEHFARWMEMEAGVHARLMSWLEPSTAK